MRLFAQKPKAAQHDTPAKATSSGRAYLGHTHKVGLSLQRACARGGVEHGEKDAAAPAVVQKVMSSSGHPLDSITRGFMEPRLGHDFSRVRVHTDARAEDSARALGARAYTVGSEVVFGAGQFAPHTTEGRRLLAHELTHVVQQRGAGAPPASARLGFSSVPQEAEAERAAQAVTGGEAPLPIREMSAPVLAKQGTGTGTASGAAARVLEALNRPDPIAGVGNPREALTILRGLSGEELVAAVIEVDDHFLLDMLLEAIGMSDQSEVGAVIYAVRFTSPHGTPDDRYGIQSARGLAQLPVDEQDRVLARVLARRGTDVSIAQVREGMQALEESESVLTAEGYEEVDELSTSPGTLMAGVAMGPWNPGRMPVPFYIGNSAHIAIAAEYAGLHRADAAFYNFSPISAILAAAAALGLTINPLALRAAQLGLKPDIANITRRHLYEIKPAGSQSLAAAEARLYMLAFAAAGLPMALGPTSEPGTSGTVPAPGGWYVFTSPEIGVITYRYRQPRRRRVRVRAPQPRTSPAMDRSLVESIQAATGLTGTALIIYIIISEGSRLFPPRNLVPVP